MTTITEDEMKNWAEGVCGTCEKKFRIQPVAASRSRAFYPTVETS